MDCSMPGLLGCWSFLKLMSIKSVMPSNHLILCHPLLLLPSIFPSIKIFSSQCMAKPIQYCEVKKKKKSFLMSQLFSSGGQSIGVSASASVLPMNIQDWSPLGWTGWSPCSPRDSQESFSTPQFKSISSSILNFLYGPTLTPMHDHWKNHSFD